MSFFARPSSTDLRRITATSYYLTKRNRQTGAVSSLGFFDVGSLNLPFALFGLTKEVDQVNGIAKGLIKGAAFQETTFDLSINSHEFAALQLLNGYLDSIGANHADGPKWKLGNKEVDIDDVCYELTCVPVANVVNGNVVSWANSFQINKAFVTFDSPLNFVGNKDEFQSLSVSLTSYQDLDQPGSESGFIGNIAALGDDLPIGLWHTTGAPVSPFKHVAELTLPAAGKADTNWYATYKAGERALGVINVSGGINSSVTTIPYTKTSGQTAPSSGDFLQIEDEVFQCTGTPSDTSIPVIARGSICGTLADSHANATAIAVIVPYHIWVSQKATFVSDDATKVTVGNTAGVDTNARKARIVNIATGSADIDATVYLDGLDGSVTPGEFYTSEIPLSVTAD